MLSIFVIMNIEKAQKRQESKDKILGAAKKLFLEEGFAKTSMRKIAAEIGVSPTTIYLYFKDKADMMYALHHEGFKLLNKQLKALEYVEDPFERLKAIGRLYISFALENREFYEIMFIMEEPIKHIENSKLLKDGWQEGEDAYQLFLAVIEACQKKGYFKGYNLNNFALLLWANIHGLCALKNNGHLNMISQEIDDKIDIPSTMQSCFNMYIKMIENI